jgi:molybdate transport system ATP-binding protein
MTSGSGPLLAFAAEKQLGAFRFAARFETPAAGLLALFGRSGAGKTTLINLLAGLARPDRGRIVLNDLVLFDSQTGTDLPPERRRIGYVFQEGRLFPHMDVRRNLLYGRRRSAENSRDVSFEEIVRLLGIGHLLARRPSGLSGGERQRVAIGRALLANPRLLLLDEPLAALDGERKAEILPYIERLRDDINLPIVYVSHDPAEIIRLADQVLLLEQGGIVATGSVADIFSRPDLQQLVGADEAGVVLTARLISHDDTDGLSFLQFAGGRLAVPRLAVPTGNEVRLRVRARDVSIAATRPQGLSIQNILPAKITGIHSADDAHVDVELDAGTPLRARVTHRAVRDLSLAIGMPVFALIKAVSVDRQAIASRGPASNALTSGVRPLL